MSGYYPDGCTQADHDRAFGELGPSPAELAAEADAENDFDADYPDAPETMTNEFSSTDPRNPSYVSREEADRAHQQYEYACRVAGEVAAHIGEPWPEPKPEHDFVIACPGGYLHKDGGEACQFNDTDLILVVGQMEAEDLCAGRKDTHRAVKVSVYFDRIEKGWK